MVHHQLTAQTSQTTHQPHGIHLCALPTEDNKPGYAQDVETRSRKTTSQHIATPARNAHQLHTQWPLQESTQPTGHATSVTIYGPPSNSRISISPAPTSNNTPVHEGTLHHPASLVPQPILTPLKQQHISPHSQGSIQTSTSSATTTPQTWQRIPRY